MTSSIRFLAISAALILCYPVMAELSIPPTVFGFRGDGNGRYPNANPPLDWGRISKSVKELSGQSRKPNGDAPLAKECAVPDGVIRQWLVLGPLPFPESRNGEDLLTNIESLSPDANDKVGDKSWQAVTTDSSCLDFCSLFSVPTEKTGLVAFAHAYLYSPSGTPVSYNTLFQGQGTCRIWLNGKQIYFSGKNVDIGPGGRLVLPLQKGWNRFLVMNAKSLANRNSWWNTGGLFAELGAAYESHGIAWMTPTHPCGASAPVIMGDRLFFTGEDGVLLCANKADGKLLWSRSHTYYDFATDEERKANPAVFAALDPLVQQLKKTDLLDMAVPWKIPVLEKDFRWSMEGPIFANMMKVSKDKYNNPATWGCEAGFTACAPVTDGHFVYALFGTGIVVCYDRDGNLKWKRLIDHKVVEHGYTTSPLLVDGKLVVYLGSFTVLDAKSGDTILERPHFATPGKAYDWYTLFHGTGCVLQAGNEKVIYYLNGEFVRLSDGKSLTLDPKKLAILGPANYTEGGANRCATPVVDNGICYKLARGGSMVSFKLPPLVGDKVDPEIVREVAFNTDKFPYFYGAGYCASPLYHEGLVYLLNDFGTLTVMDMNKGEVLYSRQLDIDIYMPYAGAGYLKGGASSSPTLAGKYIYIFGNQGTAIILEPGRTFKQIAKLRIENLINTWGPRRQEVTMTEPVFEGERMYYRAEYTVFCIGVK